MMTYDLILKNIGRHISLTADEQNLFTSLLQARMLSRKEFLLSPGEISRFENFVNKGCLRVYSIDNKGNEHIVMFAPEDWWAGDMYSFLTQTKATFYIDALEDAELWQIEKSDLELLYERVPQFNRLFRILLQNAFVAQQQRISQNLAENAEKRYELFLQKYKGLDQRIPQKQIAAYLGITPEFLSSLRNKLAKGKKS